VIGLDSRWKSYFDIIILFMVGYSCFTSIYYVAFSMPTDQANTIITWVVEGFFYADLAFNFICEYKDPDSNMPVRDLKQISIHYVSTWFIIDFVSVFPFREIFQSGGSTKLFRLARMPRLIKLLNVEKFNAMLRRFRSNKSSD